ncbi:hypothetical protein Tco_0089477 [Tanacetum coccineum]
MSCLVHRSIWFNLSSATFELHIFNNSSNNAIFQGPTSHSADVVERDGANLSYSSPSSLLRLEASAGGSLKKHGDKRWSHQEFLRRRLLHLLSWQRPTWVPGLLRSFVPDDDTGSGGPLRRIRQKANLLMLRDKRELGYTALQQPNHASQKLLLMNESELKIVKGAEKIETQACMVRDWSRALLMLLQHLEKMDLKEKSSGSTKSPTKLTLDMLHGQALRSLEKVDSPKLLSYPHDNQKSGVQHHERLHDSRELTSKGKEKVEENGPRKFPIKFIFL